MRLEPRVLFLTAMTLAWVLAHGQRAWADWPTNGVAVCTAPDLQDSPAIATTADGSTILAWRDFREPAHVSIYAARLLSTGSLDSRWLAQGNPTSESARVGAVSQISSVVVPDRDNGAFVLWVEYSRGVPTDIYAQHLGSDGQIGAGWRTRGLPICTAQGPQDHLRAIGDGSNGVLAVWTDGRRDDQDIYAQRITSAGTLADGWPINGIKLCGAAGNQSHPDLVSDGAGGAFVVWMDARGEDDDVFAQHVLGSGAIAAGWPADGAAVCQSANDQRTPRLVGDDRGGAIVTWEDQRSGNSDVYAQRIGDEAPAGAWGPSGVAICTATGPQYSPMAVSDGAGGAMVFWTDERTGNSNVYGLGIDSLGVALPGWRPDGTPLSPTDYIGLFSPQAIADGNGGAYVTWSAERDPRVGDYDIVVQRISGAGAIAPGWPARPGVVCSASGDQSAPVLTRSGDQVVIGWVDGRSGVPLGSDIYAAAVQSDGSTPTLSSLASVQATPTHVALTWYLDARQIREVTIDRADHDADWIDLQTSAGVEHLTFDDHDVVPGRSYRYRLKIDVGGETAYSDEVAVSVPNWDLRLARVRPLLSRRTLEVAYSLPTTTPATLALFDIQGRRVASVRVSTTAPGPQSARLTVPDLRPGVWILRLSQGMASQTLKLAIAN